MSKDKKRKRKKSSLVEYLKLYELTLQEEEKQIIVDGIPTDYTIKRNGDVTSYKCRGTDKPITLVHVKDGHGYHCVNIMVGSHQKMLRVYRLVAEYFLPNPEKKPQVNHIDGNKDNNDVSNLEWCTEKENIQHAVRTGLKVGKKGEKHPMSKSKEQLIRKICELLTTKKYTRQEIADMLGTTLSVVAHVKKRDRWNHITVEYPDY